MYSDCSAQYWKRRSKPTFSKAKMSFLLVLVLPLILLVRNSHRNRQNERNQRILLEERRNTRPQATEKEYEMCESNMRDMIQTECAKLCNDEIGSIPRPLMYESCSHGCSRSIYSAAVVGCREGSVEEAFQKESQLQAMNSCSRFQQVEPKPFVLSTCRKYYREGTKTGRNLGFDFINRLIESKWARIRNEI